MNARTWWLAAVMVAVLALGAPALAGPSVDVGLSCTWYGQVPVIVALEKGWFKEAGVDVKMQTIVTSADRMLALTAGAIGWANTGSLATVGEMAKGNRSFYVIGMIDDAGGQEGVAARAGINKMEELRGKKVAVPGNSSAEVTLSLLLKDAGLARSDVEVIPLAVTEITTAFARGQIDAYAVWEPTLTSALKGAAGSKILATNNELRKRHGTIAASDVVVMRRDLVDGSPQTAGGILKGLTRALAHVKANPSDAAATVAGCYRTEAKNALDNIRLFTYHEGTKQKAEAASVLTMLNQLVDWAHTYGRITTRPDPAEWMNTKLWPE